MSDAVQVIGLTEANRALRALPGLVKDRAQQVMDVTAFQVLRAAEARVPRRTGALARALGWRSRPRSLSAIMGVAPKTTFYWKYLEYGTVAMTARPFLRPAAESQRADHHRRLLQALEKSARETSTTAGER